jgi:hypothetical protein
MGYLAQPFSAEPRNGLYKKYEIRYDKKTRGWEVQIKINIQKDKKIVGERRGKKNKRN